jgi:predicted Zn finger-like uncharacterized protein
MPLVTSCPECNTQFVVKKEQLKAFEGQVRCGTCQHVFNADTQTEAAEHIEITAPSHLQDQFNEDTDVLAPASHALPASLAKPESAQDQHQTPSFLNDLTVNEPLEKGWRRKPFSWPVFILCALLIVLLFAQSVYFMRTEIAALYPKTKLWFTQICQPLKCSVPLPKNINLLTIDDSDMQEHLTYQNVLVFSSTLINHANYAQAYPNIELTLTNTEDEPVLRRTFQASEYLQNQAVVSQGIAAKDEMRIKLHLNTTDIPVAGYRVSLNYP